MRNARVGDKSVDIHLISNVTSEERFLLLLDCRLDRKTR